MSRTKRIINRARDGYARLNGFLDTIAMYRLVLYVLIGLLVVGFVYSFFGTLGLAPFTPVDFLISCAVILGTSWLTNKIFAKVFEAPTNTESVYITALILMCIITPPSQGTFLPYLSLAIWASVWAMASKYIFAIGKKHIFNPAAIALVITWLSIHQAASWWIGRGDMLPFVALGGLLVVIKIRRFHMVLTFMATALVSVGAIALLSGADPIFALSTTFSDTALVFFATIMLSEPLTTPPTKRLRIAYAILVGFLFAPNLHIGSVYSTPELALVLGNVFSYLVSPKRKYILSLKDRVQLANNTFEYVFAGASNIHFRPGQYMEWLLPHENVDSRGNRRYFTIASSPKEKELRIGVRQSDQSSSFKKYLKEMPIGTPIIAAQIAGDFVLPKDANERLVFIAGGIGITPFRSMIQYLLDTGEKRDITLLYANRNKEDVAYMSVFDRANAELGVKTIYLLDDLKELRGGSFRSARITTELIKEVAPEFQRSTFYISGPNAMVSGVKTQLKSIGIQSRHIKTDYFPGLA